MVDVKKMCVTCRGYKNVAVDEVKLFKYQSGGFAGVPIQEAFPEMSAADREFFFLTGMCGECFDSMFNFEDDEF